VIRSIEFIGVRNSVANGKSLLLGYKSLVVLEGTLTLASDPVSLLLVDGSDDPSFNKAS
jgi:hypothetical protein